MHTARAPARGRVSARDPVVVGWTRRPATNQLGGKHVRSLSGHHVSLHVVVIVRKRRRCRRCRERRWHWVCERLRGVLFRVGGATVPGDGGADIVERHQPVFPGLHLSLGRAELEYPDAIHGTTCLNNELVRITADVGVECEFGLATRPRGNNAERREFDLARDLNGYPPQKVWGPSGSGAEL